MLAEAHAASSGWLAFVTLLVTIAAVVPLLAALLRLGLPRKRRARRRLPPLRLGQAPTTRRSPRHAVAAHRSLLMQLFFTGIALLVLPLLAALGRLELQGLLMGVALIAPVLVVALQSRRRDLAGSRGPRT